MGQKGIVHIPIIIVVLVAVGLVVVGNVQTSVRYDEGAVAGILISKGDSENSGKSGSSKDREEKRDDNSNRGSSQENRIRHEVRTSDERIKTEIREDRTRIDVYQGNTKTRFEQKGNEFIIKTEIEEEDEVEEDEVEDEATESAEEPELVQELRAISKFPLRIDLSTNQLIMTKGGVERVLTVLPAHAVQNMLRAHLKKGLGPKFFQDATPSATPESSPSASPTPEGTASASPSASPTEEPEATESAELTILESEISLEERNDQIVYKIPAKKHLKLLGFIPVSTNLTGYVSAETGILLEETQSLLARIIDLLSP
ncbi:hypothetical protein HYT18_00720 [Candidatus Microgenomates bacterium]|nr:hypothetical protein [Candidatus Microgenomates bacterium]